MKRYFSLFLSLVLLLSILCLTGCASGTPAESNAPTSAPTDAPTEPTPTDPTPTEPADPPADPNPTPSDARKSFQFQLNGKSYQFPCTYQDFADNGYSISTNASSLVAGHTQLITPESITMGNGSGFTVCFLNNQPGPVTVAQCAIEEMYFTIHLSGENRSTSMTIEPNAIELAEGISGSSTPEQIKAAWGEPTNTTSYDTDSYTETAYIYETMLNGTKTEVAFVFYTRYYDDGSSGTFLEIQFVQELSMISAPEYDDINIHTIVPESWGNPNCWAWEDGGEDAYDAWPGQAMSEQGQFWVTQAPEWVNGIIIANHNGSIQTADIPVEMGKDVWVVVHNGDDIAYTLYYSEPTAQDLAAAGY